MQTKFHGLDANFINPSPNIIEKKIETERELRLAESFDISGGVKLRSATIDWLNGYKDTTIEEFKNAEDNWSEFDEPLDYPTYKSKYDVTDMVEEKEAEANWTSAGGYVSVDDDAEIICAWQDKNTTNVYVIIYNIRTVSSGDNSGDSSEIEELYLYKFPAIENLNEGMEGTGSNVSEVVVEDRKTSTAGQLQSSVSTWYNTLRVIALVGLLSVLVYVGIRIIISSTSQEKAKYKNMIKDWLVAICLLFVLHYIMAFTMEMTDSILGIFAENENLIGANGQDKLMTDVRVKLGEIEDDTKFGELFAEIVIYIVLVIYTIMFIIQYLKRVVMLAFLTMIAPLITLTYPIDTIKDGKAQAFGMWIKEYIYNALLPVIHIILYYMLVGSAMDFITVGHNYIYAIVAVGFLMVAEKFFRSMFGFDKATTAGQLGAAAGGALVMNAINNMKKTSGKSGGKSGDSGSSSEGKTPRYISRGGAGSNSSSDSDSETSSSSRTGTDSKAGSGTDSSSNPGANAIGSKGSAFETEVKAASEKQSLLKRENIGNGVKNLAGHYFNRGNGVRALKAAGRGIRKGAVGALGAATLGTVGLAAGVASGDLGKALQYGAAGAGAGFAGANYLGDKATELEKQNREIYKEGALGTDEYNTRNSVKELTQDNDFNRICKELGVTDQQGREALIRQFHSNGITSSQDIKKAMNVRAGNPGTSQAEIIAAQKIRQQAKQYGMKSKDIEKSLEDKGLDKDTIKTAMNLIDQL